MSSEAETTDRPQPERRRSVSLVVPLMLVPAAYLVALVSGGGSPSSAPPGPRVADFEGRSLRVRLVNGTTAAAAIARNRRAVVFVNAPYSGYAVKNGQQFLTGMLYLGKLA